MGEMAKKKAEMVGIRCRKIRLTRWVTLARRTRLHLQVLDYQDFLQVENMLTMV